ncbi:stress response protein YsnF [Azospirillum agricola]|uniref:YsnF/AvaK domain-containing protein n=1 Tax=Azospirillum agricola TaxID=1720247 RepID=UPI001AE62D8B|nr:YsnF/AvaK domain-containing protein [Azospirillum agricola]MBP2232345.1 stress response protein YsnF [Azospirillum agricola]
METGSTGERVIVPLAEEIATVHKTARASGGVRVRKTVQETFQDIDETVRTQEVTVRRVPAGRWIDEAPRQRQEGDTTIIPIVEEVAVIETRLRLVEEIHVTRRSSIRPLRTAVPVRRERAEIEAIAADGTAIKAHHHTNDDTNHDTDDDTRDGAAAAPVPALRRTAMTTIIGLFTDATAAATTAQQARTALHALGDSGADIRVFGSGGDGTAADLRAALSGLEIDDADIQALAGSLERRALIVTARVSADRTEAVVEIMTENGAEGTDVFDGPDEERLVLPEAEESIDVAKTSVTTGVRARSTVTERPVHKTVTLKDETVQARRRDADRDLSPEEAEAAFQERTVEVTGVSEEAEIRKAARLIGEVEITKDSQERQEVIRDTVRRTEVETQRIERHR